MAVKARRVNLCPTDGMGSDAGKRWGAKHCCAKACSCATATTVTSGVAGPAWCCGHMEPGRMLAMRPCCQSPGKPPCQPAVSSVSTGCFGTSYAGCSAPLHCSAPLPALAVPLRPRAPSQDPWLPGTGERNPAPATLAPRSRVGWGKPYAPARGAGTDASPAAHRGWQGVAGRSRGLLRTGVRYLAGCRGGRVQLAAARKKRKEKRRGERQRAAEAL